MKTTKNIKENEDKQEKEIAMETQENVSSPLMAEQAQDTENEDNKERGNDMQNKTDIEQLIKNEINILKNLEKFNTDNTEMILNDRSEKEVIFELMKQMQNLESLEEEIMEEVLEEMIEKILEDLEDELGEKFDKELAEKCDMKLIEKLDKEFAKELKDELKMRIGNKIENRLEIKIETQFEKYLKKPTEELKDFLASVSTDKILDEINTICNETIKIPNSQCQLFESEILKSCLIIHILLIFKNIINANTELYKTPKKSIKEKSC